VQVPVTLSAPSNSYISVSWSTADWTAAAPGDYDASSGAITFAPGETTKAITIVIEPDVIDEPDEAFVVALSNATGATIGGFYGLALATIIDRNSPPLVGFDSPYPGQALEGDSGSKPLTLTVSLDRASGKTVTVDWSTVDITAHTPADYSAASGVVTFAPGETAKTITLSVKGDTVLEPSELFGVILSNAMNAFTQSRYDDLLYGSANLYIEDDDAVPVVTPGTTTVTEGNSGSHVVQVPVSLSSPSGKTVTASWSTADFSATAPDDYATASGTVTFAPGETSKSVAISVKGDAIDEPDEVFAVSFKNPVNATMGGVYGLGFVTVTDDDPVPVVTPGAATVVEGNSGTKVVQLPVSLSAPSGRTVTATWSTANWSAVAPGDYTAGSGTVTFAPGQTTRTVAVTVKGDVLDEADEMLVVAFANPTNAVVGGFYGLGVATITDDDPSR
jgi:hypothetical protein